MTTKYTLYTIILLSAASALYGQTVIEQWDYTSNSLVGVNGNNMTFVNTGSTDQEGEGFDNSYTVNRGSGSGGNVLPIAAQVGTAQVGTAQVGVEGDADYAPASADYAPASADYAPATTGLGLTGGTVKAEMTFSSWQLSGTNAFFAINFRNPEGTSVAQLRLQGNTAGTRVTLDGEIGQITDSSGADRGTAIGGFVSAAVADTTPVTISLTLGLDDGSYLLESSLWTTGYGGQQSGTIAGLSDATVDNFRWVATNWTAGTDFVELDQIVVSIPLLDTDGDGVGDGDDVHPGFNDASLATYLNDTWVNATNLDTWLTANNYSVGDGSTGGLTEQDLIDLRVGSTLIAVSDGSATVSLQMEESQDLSSWSDLGAAVPFTVTLDPSDDSQFFRVKLAD